MKAYWDFWLSLLLIYTTFAIPARLAFSPRHINDKTVDLATSWIVVDSIVDFFFVVDVCLNFRTGIEVEDDLVSHQRRVSFDQKRIAQQYLRSWFLIDFVSSIPLDWVALVAGQSTDLSVLKMVIS